MSAAPIESAGGYRFLPAGGPFSGGVVAEAGFNIVRVHPPRGTELQAGFRLVEKVIAGAGRPITALCAMELRIPSPLTRQGFDEFNRGYVAQYESWGLRSHGYMPAARTNVAPEFDAPAAPSLHAFCYTTKAAASARSSFVISGAPEPPGTPGGLPACWAAIAKELDHRMAALGVSWDDATETQFYGTRANHEVFATDLPRLEELGRPGLRWCFSRPPIDDLRLEIDVRGLESDVWL